MVLWFVVFLGVEVDPIKRRLLLINQFQLIYICRDFMGLIFFTKGLLDISELLWLR